jgi:uncharacterized protein
MILNPTGTHIYMNLRFPCQEKGEKSPVVIFSHTFGGNGTDNRRMQRILIAGGVAVCSFDFRGGSGYKNGRSRGDMRSMSVFTQKDDLDIVIDLIKEQDGIDPEQIYLLGASQGGFVSALVASNRPEDIKGLFLVYPAMCIPDEARQRYASIDEVPDKIELMGLTIGKTYYQYLLDYNFKDELRKYRGKVFIFHGDQDEIADISYSEEAVKLYDNAKLYVMRGEGHGFSKKVQRLLSRFIINEILGPR